VLFLDSVPKHGTFEATHFSRCCSSRIHQYSNDGIVFDFGIHKGWATIILRMQHPNARNHPAVMSPSCFTLALSVVSLFTFILPTLNAMPQSSQAGACSFGRRPINPKLFGKSIHSDAECDIASSDLRHSLRLEPWAVIYSPLWLHNRHPNVCPPEIIAVFRRSNKPAMVYYRRAVKKSFFPEVPKKDPISLQELWPCDKIPLQKFFAWGPGRKQFNQHIKTMYTGIEKLRTTHCYDDFYGRKKTWTREELETRVLQERISSTAQSYLDSVAFNSFTCI